MDKHFAEETTEQVAKDSVKKFADLSREKQPTLVVEFWYFLRENKKWWLVPLLLTLGVYGFFLCASLYGGPAFIYAIF